MRFDDLKLMPLLLQNVQAAGYETPTPIQQATIPLVLAGKDVLGCTQRTPKSTKEVSSCAPPPSPARPAKRTLPSR